MRKDRKAKQAPRITIKELYLYKNYSTLQLLIFFRIYIKELFPLQIFVSKPNWLKDLSTINYRFIVDATSFSFSLLPIKAKNNLINTKSTIND